MDSFCVVVSSSCCLLQIAVAAADVGCYVAAVAGRSYGFVAVILVVVVVAGAVAGVFAVARGYFYCSC